MKRIGTALRKTARRRWHTFLLAAILCLTLTGTVGVFYYQSLNSRVKRDDGYYFPAQVVTEPDDEAGLATDLEDIDIPRLQQSLEAWAQEESLRIEDRSVLNILLCGVDSETGDAQGGYSDAMILISINKRKREVFVTSFLRDSCSYIDLTRDPFHPRTDLGRTSAAYSQGGPATLTETLSANYKIGIDAYICVDFDSFPRLVDTLGGVALDISRSDAGYINRTAPSMEGKFPWGEAVQLTGQQALIYSRIRYDSDEDRTVRQRQVLLAILERARESSPGQIVKVLSELLPQVRTDLSEDQVDSLAKDALTQGWLNYDVTQLHSPTPGGKRTACLSAYVSNRYMWIVDYPGEAQRLQLAIYGETLIESSKGTGGDYLAELFDSPS